MDLIKFLNNTAQIGTLFSQKFLTFKALDIDDGFDTFEKFIVANLLTHLH